MTKSIFHGAGYYLNDNRASGGKKAEDDLFICTHCEQTLLKAVWKQAGGMCTVCAAPICITCYDRTHRFGCEGPMVKKLETAVNEAYRREQNAKVLGI